MIIKIKSKELICFFLLCFLVFFPGSKIRAAEEITLEDAIAWGLNHSPSLLDFKDNVEKVERQLVKIKAGLNWQADLTGNLAASNQGSSSIAPNLNQEKAHLEVGLQGSKAFFGGLSIGPKLSLKKEITEAEDNPELGFSFNVTQKLYPWTPSSEEKEYYATLNTLKKAEDNLKWQAETKKLDWLEGYLNLLRLREKVKVAEEQYFLAQNDFDLISQRQQIGEAGRQQVLAEQVRLKQAEYNLKQAENNFNEEEKLWSLELGLPIASKVKLVEENIYFQQIKAELATLTVAWSDSVQLMSMVDKNHYQLAAKRLDRKQLREEWGWKKDEKKPAVTTGGTYNYPGKEWKLNLNLAYNFWDGGVRKLENEDYQAQLNSLEREYQNLTENLHNQLRKLLNQVDLAKLQLEEKNLYCQKITLEKEIYQQQLAAGLITKKEWVEKSVEYRNAEISIKEAEDKVFLSKLRVLHFIGMI